MESEAVVVQDKRSIAERRIETQKMSEYLDTKAEGDFVSYSEIAREGGFTSVNELLDQRHLLYSALALQQDKTRIWNPVRSEGLILLTPGEVARGVGADFLQKVRRAAERALDLIYDGAMRRFEDLTEEDKASVMASNSRIHAVMVTASEEILLAEKAEKRKEIKGLPDSSLEYLMELHRKNGGT